MRFFIAIIYLPDKLKQAFFSYVFLVAHVADSDAANAVGNEWDNLVIIAISE